MSTLVAVAIAVSGAALVFRAYRRREPDPFIRRLVPIALVAKLLGTFAYYFVIQNIYGSGDVTGYINAGRRLAPAIRSGSLPENALEPGTRFTEFLTGLLFSIVGPNELIGYVVFSMLSFIGMVLFFHAFRMAVPDGDHHRYALLVFLLPTMLFWPSTIGKDTWVVFTMGIAAYGAARVLRGRRFGYLLIGASLVGMAMVRPHMATLFAVSFMAAFLMRFADRSVKRSATGWIVGVMIIGVGVSLALVNLSDQLGRTEYSEDTATTDRVLADVDEIFERTDRLTRDGGGQFASRPVRTPLDVLHALGTVPFRPFPWEGHNYQAQIAGLEGLVLFGFLLTAAPRLGALPRRLTNNPYVLLATVYTFGFVIAFSNVANFGILTRQRAQLVPLLLVLVALPRPSRPAVRSAKRSKRGVGRGPLLVYLPPSSDSADDTGGDQAPPTGTSRARVAHRRSDEADPAPHEVP